MCANIFRLVYFEKLLCICHTFAKRLLYTPVTAVTPPLFISAIRAAFKVQRELSRVTYLIDIYIYIFHSRARKLTHEHICTLQLILIMIYRYYSILIASFEDNVDLFSQNDYLYSHLYVSLSQMTWLYDLHC